MRQAEELLGVLEPRPVLSTVSAWGPSSSDQFRGIWIFRGNKESGGGTCEQRVLAIPLLDVGFQDQDG